ncbi:MAG: substrate-binding domain-containing protein [Oscillospiraceae bacterium]|nr:substrate-binding domain-containing protein [Oscillospiraceae bacterium]
MKKILSVLLVLVMAFALFACAGSGNDSNDRPTQPPANGGEATGPADELPPVSDHVPDGAVGFVTDDVDHWARDSYHIVYFNFNPTGVTGQIALALEQLGEVWNFTVTQMTANNDSDAFINNLQTILIAGDVDGLIVDITDELATRASAVLRDFDVPAVCVFNAAVDFDGHMLIPSIIMDQYLNGWTQVNHINDVYRDFWGEVDRSQVALLVVDHSTNIALHQRYLGARSAFEALFPENAGVFYGDTGADSISAENGFLHANALLSANPDIQYWFAVGTVEDNALGMARAIEALNMDDRVLLTSSGAGILPSQWDEGYVGAWIANYSIPPFLYSGVAVFGLIAMMDGRATMETLWPDMFLPGDQAARFVLEAGMMTRDNYVEYIANFMRQFGVDPAA